MNNDIFKEIITTVIRGKVDGAFFFDDIYPMRWLHDYKKNPSEVERILRKAMDEVAGHAYVHTRVAMDALVEYYLARHGKKYKNFAYHLAQMSIALHRKEASKYLQHYATLHTLWTN